MGTGIGSQYAPQNPRAESAALEPALADWNGNRAQRRMAKRLKLPKPPTPPKETT